MLSKKISQYNNSLQYLFLNKNLPHLYIHYISIKDSIEFNEQHKIEGFE